MRPTARALALLSLLVFARLAAAGSEHSGEDVPPMNPPIIESDDPNIPVTYSWPSQGAWPLSDDDEALARAYAAEEAAYLYMDILDDLDYLVQIIQDLDYLEDEWYWQGRCCRLLTAMGGSCCGCALLYKTSHSFGITSHVRTFAWLCACPCCQQLCLLCCKASRHT